MKAYVQRVREEEREDTRVSIIVLPTTIVSTLTLTPTLTLTLVSVNTHTYSRVFISIVMLNNNCVSTHTSPLHLQTIKCCVVFRFVTTERRPIESVTKPTLPSHTTRHKLKRSSSKTCFVCPAGAIPRMFLLAALFIPCPVPILEKCLTKVTPVTYYIVSKSMQKTAHPTCPSVSPHPNTGGSLPRHICVR